MDADTECKDSEILCGFNGLSKIRDSLKLDFLCRLDVCGYMKNVLEHVGIKNVNTQNKQAKKKSR